MKQEVCEITGKGAQQLVTILIHVLSGCNIKKIVLYSELGYKMKLHLVVVGSLSEFSYPSFWIYILPLYCSQKIFLLLCKQLNLNSLIDPYSDFITVQYILGRSSCVSLTTSTPSY